MVKTISITVCIYVVISLYFLYLNLVLEGRAHLNMRLNFIHCSVDKRNIQFFLKKGMSCSQIKQLVPEERFRVHCGNMDYCKKLLESFVE